VVKDETDVTETPRVVIGREVDLASISTTRYKIDFQSIFIEVHLRCTFPITVKFQNKHEFCRCFSVFPQLQEKNSLIVDVGVCFCWSLLAGVWMREIDLHIEGNIPSVSSSSYRTFENIQRRRGETF
jgi:hypothetical protein